MVATTAAAAAATLAPLPSLLLLATGSAVILSLVLCLELESLSLSFFRFGFFMFRTTLPVDLTGARLLFIGIVAVLGSGAPTFTSTVNGAAVGNSSTFSAPDCLVDGFSLIVLAELVGTISCSVAVVVDAVSQWSLHLHGLLFSMGKPKRKSKKKLILGKTYVVYGWYYSEHLALLE